jgi:hypothetical protein
MNLLNHPLIDRNEVLSTMSDIVRQCHRLRAIEMGLITPAHPTAIEEVAMADPFECPISFWNELEYRLNSLEPENFGVPDDDCVGPDLFWCV